MAQKFPRAGLWPAQESRFAHVQTDAAETVIVERMLSISFIAALPEGEREAFAARIRKTIAEEPALAGKASVDYPLSYLRLRRATALSYFLLTFQIVPLPSSEKNRLPLLSKATPTGRPQTSLSLRTNPVTKSS